MPRRAALQLTAKYIHVMDTGYYTIVLKSATEIVYKGRTRIIGHLEPSYTIKKHKQTNTNFLLTLIINQT